MTSHVDPGELVHSCLEGNSASICGFVDNLLTLTTNVGHVTGMLLDPTTITFRYAGNDQCDVRTERAKSKFRMVCARLGVLLTDRGRANKGSSLYGGEGCIPHQIEGGRLAQIKVSFKNTADEQRFDLHRDDGLWGK